MTNGNNYANSFDAIVVDVFANEVKQGGKQTAMLKYMFDSEVTFNMAFINGYHAETGAKKVAYVDEKLIAISPAYAKLHKKWSDAKADKTMTDEKRRGIVDGCYSQLTAVREMFKRCLVSLHYLFSVKATSLKVKPDGRMIIEHTVKDENGKEVEDTNTFTGRELTRHGVGVAPKGKPRSTAGNVEGVAGKGFIDAASIIERSLKSEKDGDLQPLGEEPLKATKSLLVTLLLREFGDEAGKLDEQAIRKFVVQYNSPPMNAEAAEKVRAKDALPEDEATKKAEQEAYAKAPTAAKKTTNKRASSKKR